MLERVGEQGRTGIALKPDRDEMEQTKARLQRMLWCVENRESHEAASHLMTDVERREEKKKRLSRPFPVPWIGEALPLLPLTV